MNKEGILRWIIYVGAGLLAFTPLIVANGMYFPFITGKAFFFRIIVILMFGAWVILALYDKEVRPQWSAVAVALASLVGVALVASIFGVNPSDSIWSNFERMMGWITLLHVGLLFTTLAHTLRAEHWRNLFYLSLGVSVITALISFGEVPDENRVDATLGNPIYLAVYAVFHLLVAGYLMLRRIKKRLQSGMSIWADWGIYIYSAIGILNLLALYFSKTRGAILGLMVGLFVGAVLVAIFERNKLWVRRVAIGLVVAGLVLVGGFFTFQDSEFVQNQPVLERFANISLEEGNAGARLDTWKIALNGYTQDAKTVAIGWGPGNFNYVFNTYYSPRMFDDATWFDRVHNVALEWLVAAGPLGFLSYLALFGTAIYLIWRDPKEAESRKSKVESFSVLEKSLLTSLVIAYLVQNLFVFDHLVSLLILTMILGWLHSRSIQHSAGGILERIKGWFSSDDIGLSEAGKAWASTGVGLAVIALAVVWNYPGYVQATTLIDALRHEQNQPQQALQFYQEAIHADKDRAMGTQEARERLSDTASKIANSQGASSTIAQEYLSVASQEIEAQIEEEPEDLRHRIFYGQMLMAYDQYEAAIQQFSRANEMSNGQKQLILFQLAEAQANTGQGEEALENYRQAYELNTSFDTPAVRYAAMAIRVGDQELAERVLEDHFGSTSVDHNVLIQAYASVGNYEKIIPIFEARLEENPNDPQSYVSLAAVLERADRDGEAISILEQAIERFPQGEAQINEIIERIRDGEAVSP